MALPAPDFLLSLYLVPEALQSKAPIAGLVELERLLQTAQFSAFWTAAGSAEMRSVLGRVPGVDDALRAFIGTVLEHTYARLDSAVACTALNLADCAPFVKAAGWAQAADGTIVLPVTADNSARPKMEGTAGLGLNYNEISGMVAQLARHA